MIKWKLPRRAADVELRRSWNQLKALRWHYLATWVILGGSKLYQVLQLHPHDLARTAAGIVAIAAVLPALGYLYLYLHIRFIGVRYDINDSGLRRRSDRTVLYRWDNVDAFRFGDYPGVPGIRVMDFRVQRTQKWRRWAFDPSEVKESAIRAIMENRLPGKHWDKKPGSQPKRKK